MLVIINSIECEIMMSVEHHIDNLTYLNDYIIIDIFNLKKDLKLYNKDFINILIETILSANENITDIDEYILSKIDISDSLVDRLSDLTEEIIKYLYNILDKFLDGNELHYKFHLWLDDNTLIIKKRYLDNE